MTALLGMMAAHSGINGFTPQIMSSNKVSKAVTRPAKKKKKTTGSSKPGKSLSGKKTTGATGKKKKTTRKKAASRQSTARKTKPRKTSKASKPRTKKVATAKTTATSGSTAENEDTRSLSWMSARANSALKAVKANQAEKGQAVLAKTRKRQTGTLIDDESLIRIAADMPVDNDALMQFTAEDPVASAASHIEPTATLNTSHDEAVESVSPDQDDDATKAETDETSGIGTTPDTIIENSRDDPAPDATATTPPAYRPPPPAPRPSPWPARVGVLMVALALGYLFWPESDDRNLTETVLKTFHQKDKVDTHIDVHNKNELADNFKAAPDVTAVEAPAAPVDTSAGVAVADHNSPSAATGVTTPWQPSFIPQTVETAPAADTEVVTDAAPLAPQASGIETHRPATTVNPPVAPAAGYGRPAYGYYPPAPQHRPGYRPYYPR